MGITAMKHKACRQIPTRSISKNTSAAEYPVSYTHLDVYKRQVSCRSKYPVTDARTEEYVQALTDMIHQVADNDAPEPEKNAGQGEKAS